MKYYLVKYKNGLFVYIGYERPIERIKTFRPTSDYFFKKLCIDGTIVSQYIAERGHVIFESVDLDEIVERAALESL